MCVRGRGGVSSGMCYLNSTGTLPPLPQPQRAECVDFTETEGQREEGGRKTSMEKTGHRAKLQYYNGGGSKVKE